MHESGCHLLYPLAEEPVIGLWPAVQRLPFFVRLLRQVEQWFARSRPDLVVLIDNPGFNWWVARRARQYGIPVWYFVPPQLWAWGGWRVRKMRRLVERVLCGLPFEAAWFRRRGVRAEYIGHPYCDALHQQRYDETFLQQQRERGGTIVGLLPGSRRREVEHNFPSLYRTAQLLSLDRPELRFLVACYRQEHADWIRRYLQQHDHNAAAAVSSHGQTRGHAPTLCERLEVHVGRTAEIIQLSRVCAAVSGSVTLELLYHARPACVLYRIPAWTKCLAPILLRCRYVTLVNLLAERELFPEFVRVRCPAGAMAQTLRNWLENAERWQECHQALLELRQRFFQPGACQRAASLMLQRLQAGYAAAA
jgi:lipid-A-disaccharide synthase